MATIIPFPSPGTPAWRARAMAFYYKAKECDRRGDVIGFESWIARMESVLSAPGWGPSCNKKRGL